MINRRTFTTLLTGAAVAPQFSSGPSWGQAADSNAVKGQTVFYSAVGGDLVLYSMNLDEATLTRRSTVSVPANVQYAWPHPSKQFLYVVSSTRGSGGVEGNPD